MRTVLTLMIASVALAPALAMGAPLSRMDAVSLYAADASAVLAEPMPSSRRTTADDTLARQVTDAISGIIASGAAQVEVSVTQGEVTLNGEASSEQVVNQLLDTAGAVYGVKEVKSAIKLSAS
jgi:osmotically-inducible protein OsmY